VFFYVRDGKCGKYHIFISKNAEKCLKTDCQETKNTAENPNKTGPEPSKNASRTPKKGTKNHNVLNGFSTQISRLYLKKSRHSITGHNPTNPPSHPPPRSSGKSLSGQLLSQRLAPMSGLYISTNFRRFTLMSVTLTRRKQQNTPDTIALSIGSF